MQSLRPPAVPPTTLRRIGYWRNEQHPEYPDPHDLVDPTWDGEDRQVVAAYLWSGVFLRGYMGLSPCRICGRHNGAAEYTDGVLVWPEGLSHYLEDHDVRLPRAIEQYVLRTSARHESAVVSNDWWVAGAPEDAGDGPLDPLVRLRWAGNTQLVLDPTRQHPGLLVQGDTLATMVDGPRSRALLGRYEELLADSGRTDLPYAR